MSVIIFKIGFKIGFIIIALDALVLIQARVSDRLAILPDDGRTPGFCNITQGGSDDVFRLGEELRVTCTCPGGCSRSQLVFQHGDDVIANEKAIHAVNSSTTELRVLLTSVNQSGQYVCCRHSCEGADGGILNQTIVRVGDEPSGPLSDARCVSHGHGLLECFWRHVKTGHFLVRYSAYFGVTTGGRPRRWKPVENKDEPGLMTWDDSHFRMRINKNVNLYYSVKLCARNVLGCQCGVQLLGLLLDIMKPKAVKDARVTWYNSSAAAVGWGTPEDLYQDVDPVVYRLNYSWPDADKPAVSNVTEPNKTKMLLQDLDSYTPYSVSVEARPVAKGQLKGEWGVPVHFTFSTAKAVPQAAPEVEPGMFCKAACPSSPAHTCLFLFWKPIPHWAYGDIGVRYVVTLNDSGGTQEAETRQFSQHFRVSGNSEGTKRFTIRAANGEGASEQISELAVYYPTPPKPQEVKKEPLGEAEMSVTWAGPPDLNYSVFWCVKGSGSSCAPSEKGALHSKMVGAGVREMKISLAERAAYSYAVTSLYYDVKEGTLRSSEMAWGEDIKIVQRTTTIVKSQTAVIIGIAVAMGAVFSVSIMVVLIRKCQRNMQEDVDNTVAPDLPHPPEDTLQTWRGNYDMHEVDTFLTSSISSRGSDNVEHIECPGDYADELEFGTSLDLSDERDAFIHSQSGPQSDDLRPTVSVQDCEQDRNKMKNDDMQTESSNSLERQPQSQGEKAKDSNEVKTTDASTSAARDTLSLQKSDGGCPEDLSSTEIPIDEPELRLYDSYQINPFFLIPNAVD